MLKKLYLLFISSSLILLSAQVQAETKKAETDLLKDSGQTILGQPITYPEGQAKITTAIVTLPRGVKTGWHHHEVPMVAYMLEGELTVNYGEHGKRTYKAGDVIYEAISILHEGSNTSDKPVKILVVFIGSNSKANTVLDNK